MDLVKNVLKLYVGGLIKIMILSKKNKYTVYNRWKSRTVYQDI